MSSLACFLGRIQVAAPHRRLSGLRRRSVRESNGDFFKRNAGSYGGSALARLTGIPMATSTLRGP